MAQRAAASYLESDLACAVALGFLEGPAGHPLPELAHGGAGADDPLLAVTRDYLQRARNTPAAGALARALGWVLIVERGVLDRAAAAGWRVVPPRSSEPHGWPPAAWAGCN
jgi:hypothetical protein